MRESAPESGPTEEVISWGGKTQSYNGGSRGEEQHRRPAGKKKETCVGVWWKKKNLSKRRRWQFAEKIVKKNHRRTSKKKFECRSDQTAGKAASGSGRTGRLRAGGSKKETAKEKDPKSLRQPNHAKGC